MMMDYDIYVDDELWNTPEKIIFSINLEKNRIEWITTKDHYPYWPSITIGKIKLEKRKNEQN